MPTALDVITGALQDLGQVQAGEALNADDAVDAFSTLNDLADALSAERLWLYTIGRTAHTLASGTASYTIGSGGVINIDRPIWIDRAGLILDTTASIPLRSGSTPPTTLVPPPNGTTAIRADAHASRTARTSPASAG